MTDNLLYINTLQTIYDLVLSNQQNMFTREFISDDVVELTRSSLSESIVLTESGELIKYPPIVK